MICMRCGLTADLVVVAVCRQALVNDPHGVLVVGPRADLDGTRLLVEREELHINRTQALVDRRRLPDYQPVRMYCHFCDCLHREVPVSAVASLSLTCINVYDGKWSYSPSCPVDFPLNISIHSFMLGRIAMSSLRCGPL